MSNSINWKDINSFTHLMRERERAVEQNWVTPLRTTGNSNWYTQDKDYTRQIITEYYPRSEVNSVLYKPCKPTFTAKIIKENIDLLLESAAKMWWPDRWETIHGKRTPGDFEINFCRTDKTQDLLTAP